MLRSPRILFLLMFALVLDLSLIHAACVGGSGSSGYYPSYGRTNGASFDVAADLAP